MSEGIWFAYCLRARLMPLDDLSTSLARDAELRPRREGHGMLIVRVFDSLTGHDADVTIVVDTGPHVRLEAAELADQLEAGEIAAERGVPAAATRATFSMLPAVASSTVAVMV